MESFSSQKYQIPVGLPELLQQWMRECLRYQPQDVEMFSKEYFTALADGNVNEYLDSMPVAPVMSRRGEIAEEPIEAPLKAAAGEMGGTQTEEALPSRDMSEEEVEGIVKIQAAARGRADPKKIAELEAQTEEEALPSLDISEEEVQGVVRIQAAARGKADRKKVAEMKGKTEDAAEALPSLEMTEEEVIGIVKIQATARGRADRKKVA